MHTEFGQLCDIHVHTCYSHDCGTPLHAIKAVSRKYDMMVGITDHNRIGGNLAAHAMGIPVIPGIEVTTKSLKDFLVYFHDHDNLVEFYETTVKPALSPGKLWGTRTKITEEGLFDSLQDYDCFVSLAHPFCPFPKRSSTLPAALLRKVDAIEVMNFAMSPRANQKAAGLCKELDKVHTGGSDSHHPSTLGMVMMRGYSQDPTDFLAEIRQGVGTIVGMPRTNRDMVKSVARLISMKV